MATFQTQIEDLTGSIGDTDAITSWLTDGAKEIINVLPPSKKYLVAANNTLNNNTLTMTVNGGDILDVTRNDGTIDRPCRQITPLLRGKIQDENDVNYVTNSDPVYYLLNNTLTAYPTPTASETVAISYVSFPTVTYSANSISTFPNDYEYLVVLYAALKGLSRKMNDKTGSLPNYIQPVFSPPTLGNVGALSLPAVPTAPSAPTISSPGIATVSKADIVGAPTYTKPTFTAPTFPTINNLALPPIPTDPSFTTPDVASVTLSNSGVPPIYDPPQITGAGSELTAMVDSDWASLDFDFDDENIDFSTWFQALGDMIQNQEDMDLANSQIQKISSYLQAYTSAMQNKLHKFNESNSTYQAKLQEAIQQAQINSTEAQQEASLKLQKEFQEYQQDISKYQAEVNGKVQEYQQNEIQNKWNKYQQDYNYLLQEYQTNIQNELNEFNKENTIFQANMQTTLAKFNTDAQEAQKEGDLTLQASIQDYTQELSLYQAKISSYQAEVNAKIQQWNNQEWTQNFQKYQTDYSSLLDEYQNKSQNAMNAFTTELQKHTTDYQWLHGQYQLLSEHYQRGLQTLVGG